MPSPQDRRTRDRRSAMRGYNIALEFVGAVVGMALLGWGADAVFGWSPVGILIGLSIGLIGGTMNMIRQGIALNAEFARSQAERREASGEVEGKDGAGHE